MNVYNRQIAAATVSSASSILNTTHTYSISLQGVVTGGLQVGSVKWQVSDQVDPSGNTMNFAPTQWSDLPGSDTAFTAASTTFLIPKIDISYTWMRAVFTVSSGAGLITLYAKENCV